MSIIKLHPKQLEVAEDTHRFRILCAGRRWGKALALNTKVPMFGGGFKLLSDIKKGDIVIDDVGNPTRVTGTKIFKDRPAYKIEFSDNVEIIADENHEWSVYDKAVRKATQRAKNPIKTPYVIETKGMIENIVIGKKNEANYSIKTCDPVDYVEKELPIHPYLLGLWLGDGTKRTAEITIADKETLNFIQELGYRIGKCYGKYQWRVYDIQHILRESNLLQNKHIPNKYLYSSIEQRQWLLRGLMDSDGTVGNGGRCQFDQIDRNLILQVQQLLHSLGQKTVLCEKDATLNGTKISDAYRINFTPTIEVFHLSRKLKRQKLNDGYLLQRQMRYIKNIVRVGKQTTKCLEVDSPTHLFLVTDRFIPTHNSVLSRMIVLKWAVEKTGLYWIVSPTYKTSKMIHWRSLANEIPREWILKKNEVELSITLKNGSIIELKGAENPDALRGVKLGGLVIDEIASIRNWDWLWSEVLRPTLTDMVAPAVFISTPKGYNHFYNLFQSGQEEDNQYKSWRFTSYDNPFISKEEIDNAKTELTEDVFAQEYLADFRKHTGLVYKSFERYIHVTDPFDIPAEWTIYRGIDFGSTNPTAVLWIAVDRDENWWVVDEYYDTGKTIDYHSGVINAKPLSQRITATYGDPSGAQWISEFNQRGVYITPANKDTGTSLGNWVRLGIEKISEKLKVLQGHFVQQKNSDTQPSLFIFKGCENTIREIETYRWKEKSVTQAQDLNDPDTPEKANDHAMDALRYFAVSYRKAVNTEIKLNNFDSYRLE